MTSGKFDHLSDEEMEKELKRRGLNRRAVGFSELVDALDTLLAGCESNVTMMEELNSGLENPIDLTQAQGLRPWELFRTMARGFHTQLKAQSEIANAELEAL